MSSCKSTTNTFLGNIEVVYQSYKNLEAGLLNLDANRDSLSEGCKEELMECFHDIKPVGEFLKSILYAQKFYEYMQDMKRIENM